MMPYKKEPPYVTILTATYNRKERLKTLFQSLEEQTCSDFQWLIIDDGSTDGTEEYVKNLRTNRFIIDYYKKPNGGKHTALNYSHPYILGNVTFMVDSDDFLTSDAIKLIIEDWEKYRDQASICGISYLKQYPNGKHLSSLAPKDYFEENDIHYRVNNRIVGDRAEVLRTEYFVEFNFPEFQGEKFMSEGLLFNTLALKYNMIYRNKAIYYCEYLEDGLTRSGRQLRLNNPLGMMENCKGFFVPPVNRIVKAKEMTLYWVYGLQAGFHVKKIIETSNMGHKMIFFAPLGLFLLKLWKK